MRERYPHFNYFEPNKKFISHILPSAAQWMRIAPEWVILTLPTLATPS